MFVSKLINVIYMYLYPPPPNIWQPAAPRMVQCWHLVSDWLRHHSKNRLSSSHQIFHELSGKKSRIIWSWQPQLHFLVKSSSPGGYMNTWLSPPPLLWSKDQQHRQLGGLQVHSWKECTIHTYSTVSWSVNCQVFFFERQTVSSQSFGPNLQFEATSRQTPLLSSGGQSYSYKVTPLRN